MLEIILSLFAIPLYSDEWFCVCIFSAVIWKPCRIKSEMHFGINSHTQSSIGLSDCTFSMRLYPNVIHYANTECCKSTVVRKIKPKCMDRGNDRSAWFSIQSRSSESNESETKKKQEIFSNRIIWHLGNVSASRCKPRSQHCRCTHHQKRVITVVNISLQLDRSAHRECEMEEERRNENGESVREEERQRQREWKEKRKKRERKR